MQKQCCHSLLVLFCSALPDATPDGHHLLRSAPEQTTCTARRGDAAQQQETGLQAIKGGGRHATANYYS